MQRLICPVVISFLATPSNADTIFVCLDGSCDYTDIQDAIKAAADDDVIEIAAGTHLPGETIDTVGKWVTLRGAVDKAGIPTTIIDGRGAIGVFLPVAVNSSASTDHERSLNVQC